MVTVNTPGVEKTPKSSKYTAPQVYDPNSVAVGRYTLNSPGQAYKGHPYLAKIAKYKKE